MGPGGATTDKTRPRPKLPPKTAAWWRARELGREPHDIVNGIISTIRSQQSVRYEAYRRCASIFGADMSAFGHPQSLAQMFDEQLCINELGNKVESLHAQIFKNRIVPMPQTVGGNYDAQERAKNLGRWYDGVYDDSNFFEDVIPRVGLDSLIFGTGIIKGYSEVDGDDGRILFDAISPLDVFVDEMEGKYGKPRSIYQRMLVDRYVALDKFGVSGDDLAGSASYRAQMIETCTHTREDDDVFCLDSIGDMIAVRFAWHLPSGPGAKDGRYAVTIKNCTLVDQQWDGVRFPFAFVRYGVAPSGGGFWGRSAVQKIAAAQREFDKLNLRLQEAHDLIGIPRIIVQKGSKISKGQIDDVIGSIIECDGPAPTEWTPVPIHPETYNYRQTVSDSMGQTLGVSSYSSQSELPAGLSGASGVALSRFEDVEQARHAMLHRSYEAAVITCAEIAMDEAAILEEMGVSVPTRASAEDGVELIKWADVKLDRKQFKLRIPPASALAKTPSAKLQQLMEMLREGAISMQTFQRLSEIGDVESEYDISASDEEIILKNLTHIVSNGDYLSPIGLDDLSKCISIGHKFYNKCRVSEVSQDRLDLIAQYIDEAKALMEQSEAGAAPPPMAGPPPADVPMEGMPPPDMPPPMMAA